MKFFFSRTCIVTMLLVQGLWAAPAFGQAQPDRYQVMEQRLKQLSAVVPGLKEKADLSISNGSLQDFLKGLAETHDLNLNIDPAINQRITNYFSQETVINILLFLARQYSLDYTFIGSIITISPFRDPLANLPPPPKDIRIQYDSNSRNVTMDLQDDTLLNVARKITRLTGTNVIVMPDLYNKKVTGYIQNMPVDHALEKLAITNGFKLNSTNDSVLELVPLAQDEQIVPKQNPTMSNPNFTVRKVSKNGDAASIEVGNDNAGRKTISLNVANAPIKDVIRNISEQAGKIGRAHV